MKKYKCLKDLTGFPETREGVTYSGVKDKDGYLWLIDDFWIESGITETYFDLEIHGSYVDIVNLKYFVEVE